MVAGAVPNLLLKVKFENPGAELVLELFPLAVGAGLVVLVPEDVAAAFDEASVAPDVDAV